jgi:hypothetical protein
MSYFIISEKEVSMIKRIEFFKQSYQYYLERLYPFKKYIDKTPKYIQAFRYAWSMKWWQKI